MDRQTNGFSIGSSDWLTGGGNANTVNLDAGNFGQITTQAGTPRVFQFGIKYVF